LKYFDEKKWIFVAFLEMKYVNM